MSNMYLDPYLELSTCVQVPRDACKGPPAVWTTSGWEVTPNMSYWVQKKRMFFSVNSFDAFDWSIKRLLALVACGGGERSAAEMWIQSDFHPIFILMMSFRLFFPLHLLSLKTYPSSGFDTVNTALNRHRWAVDGDTEKGQRRVRGRSGRSTEGEKGDNKSRGSWVKEDERRLNGGWTDIGTWR